MLEEAKAQCDVLWVGLQVDPTVDRPHKNKPVQSYEERYIQLAAVKYVDMIIPYTTESELESLLRFLPIDVRILGEEYRDKDFTGRGLNMSVYFNSRNHNYSSSDLRKRIYNAESSNNQGAEVERLHNIVDQLLAHCPDAECSTCGKIVCPHGEPMHFHHDGCPACAMMEEV